MTGTLIGDTLEVAKALQILQEDGPARGLCLNVRKTEIFWPNPDPRCQAVFPSEVGRPSGGVKLLGGPVSLDAQFCSDTIHSRVDKTIHLMDCIKKLRDPQSELLLLRNCAGVSKLYFTMRTTRPQVLKAAQQRFDLHLLQYLRYLMTGDEPGFGQLHQRLATLPISDGGLGVYIMADTIHCCYIASCYQTRHLQSTILPGMPDLGHHFQSALDNYFQVCNLSSSTFNLTDIAPQPMHKLASRYFDAVKKSIPVTYTMSERDCILWQCNKKDHAQDYLKAIPIPGLNQAVGARQFSSVLQYRLGIPLFAKDNTCPCCKRATDRFEDHAIHCAREVGQKYRHDMVRDLLYELCYKAGVSAGKEVSIGLMSDRRTHRRTLWFIIGRMDDICASMSLVFLRSPKVGTVVSLQVMLLLQPLPVSATNMQTYVLRTDMISVFWPFQLWGS